MRFQRNVKIFRGQLDPAPLAGVFFLLLLFILLGALQYTPGVLVELKDPKPTDGQVISVSRVGIISFADKTYQAGELDQLRSDIANSPSHQPLVLKREPGASGALCDQLTEMLQIRPPTADGFLGTDNPVAIVAVNLRGQFFYENQLVNEDQLRTHLKNRLAEASRESKNLTLVLLEDKGVTSETFVRLSSLAAALGIKEVLLATRPMFGQPR